MPIGFGCFVTRNVAVIKDVKTSDILAHTSNGITNFRAENNDLPKKIRQR